MSSIRAATLFSGIGAPEVAMPHWNWAWHAEIEKFPSAVMAARHSGSVNLGDVSADDFTNRAAAAGRPNVLVFGSPCQSFSIAGKRLGLDDARGNLALVALGIVDRLKPDWFVFENVPGLLSSGEGRDFGAFLGTLADIGYFGCGDVLDAQWFGVAQRRNRVFVVGNPRDWRYSAAVLLEPESLCGDHPPRREAWQRPAPTIASRPTGGGGLGTDFDCDGGLIPQISHALRAEGFDASEAGTGRGVPSALRAAGGGGDKAHVLAFDCKASGQNGFGIGSIASTMRAMGHANTHQNGGGHQAVAYSIMPQNSGKDYKARPVDVAQPVMAGGPVGGNQGGDYIAGSAVRRLTPRECERLQGFPDDYTLIEYRGKHAADGPRYKALGNSMAVPVVRWILNRIELFETHVRPRLAA